MIGTVQVSESSESILKEENKINPILPDSPVDDQRNKLSRFPVHIFTNDGKYDIDMGLNPKILKILFIYIFINQ